MTAAATDPALEAALEALFAAPFPDFVEERKRLVVGLRAAGNKAAAAALGKVNRPTLASWAVNQLVRRAPAEVSAMFATAARVRLGDFAATAEHRGVIARLSALATEILREHDQPTSEATLRRITTSLQALSAYGDFAPDLPGRMIADRDPPGFDAMALESSAASAVPLSLPPNPPSPATTSAAPQTPKPAPALTVVPAAAAPAPAATAPAAPVKETAATIKARIAAKFAEREATASSSTLLAQLAASAALPEDAAAKAATPSAPSAPAATAPHLRIVPTPAAPAAPAAPSPSSSALADADADVDALAAAEAAERAVAEAAAALAAAQAAAKAAAARVHLARQKAVLEDLRTRQRRAASSIYDHEQAIALMQRELEQRQALLAAARRDSETLQADLEKITAELAALEPPAPKPSS